MRVSPQPTLSRVDAGATGAQRRGVSPPLRECNCMCTHSPPAVPSRPSQGRPPSIAEALPAPILRHLTSTSQSRAAPRTPCCRPLGRAAAARWGSSRDGGAKRPFEFLIRQCYNLRCGYRSVSETDVDMVLTSDHFQPTSRGGTRGARRNVWPYRNALCPSARVARKSSVRSGWRPVLWAFRTSVITHQV